MQYAVKTAIDALKDFKKTVDADIERVEESLKPKDTTEAKLTELHKFHASYTVEYEVFCNLQDGDDTRVNNMESLRKLATSVDSVKRTIDSITYRGYGGGSDWNKREDRQRLTSLTNKSQHIQAVITSLEGAVEENISTAELDRLGFFKIIRF